MHINALVVDIFICCDKYCVIIVAFRSMCTVSAFFSVKCASGSYQILKDVINKSQWSQTVCFVPSYGDVYNENLWWDQIWKRLSRNLKNQFKDMSLLHCYVQTICKLDYPSPVTGNPSTLYEPHGHNMASNYKGLYGMFYNIFLEVVKSENVQ